MPWYSKEQPTPFDDAQIDGLEFLSGDMLAEHFRQDWLTGKKYPLIQFPSGLTREVIDQAQGRAVHLFGTLTLPQASSRDEVFNSTQEVAQEYGYQVAKQGDHQLIVLNPYSGRGYRVRYDIRQQRIADVSHFPEEAWSCSPAKSGRHSPQSTPTRKKAWKPSRQ